MKVKIILTIIAVILSLVFIILSQPRLIRKVFETPGAMGCFLKKGHWISCARDLYNPYSLCGCIQIYNDGDKKCQSGKECSAGICMVTFMPMGIKEIPKGFYGRCPSSLSFGINPQLYEPGCQEAIIDNGLILKRNDCVY